MLILPFCKDSLAYGTWYGKAVLSSKAKKGQLNSMLTFFYLL
jgi:hypothetical protein